jgi:hypothetical protein
MHLQVLINVWYSARVNVVRTYCDNREYFSCYWISVPAIEFAGCGWACVFAMVAKLSGDGIPLLVAALKRHFSCLEFGGLTLRVDDVG